MPYCANQSVESTLHDSPMYCHPPGVCLAHPQDAKIIHGDERFARMDDLGYPNVAEKVSSPRRKDRNKEPTLALVLLALLLVLSACGILFVAPPVLKQLGFVLTRMLKNHEIHQPARFRQDESESLHQVSWTISKCHCDANPSD